MRTTAKQDTVELTRYVVVAPVPELSAEPNYVLALRREKSYLIFNMPNAYGGSDSVVRVLEIPRAAILKLLATRSEAFELVDVDLVPSVQVGRRATLRVLH